MVKKSGSLGTKRILSVDKAHLEAIRASDASWLCTVPELLFASRFAHAMLSCQ